MSDWNHFIPENMNGIEGMEKMLPDGTALEVLAYGNGEQISECSWIIRLWDDATNSYRNIASYDMGLYFDDLEVAYDALVDHCKINFSHLLSNDNICQDPKQAKTSFLHRALSFGLAALR